MVDKARIPTTDDPREVDAWRRALKLSLLGEYLFLISPATPGNAVKILSGGQLQNAGVKIPNSDILGESDSQNVSNKKWIDNVPVILGTDGDAVLYYDGNDLYLVTDIIAASDFILDCGENKTLVLAEPVTEDLQVQLSTAKLPPANSPTWRTFDYGVGGGIAFSVLGFAIGDHLDFKLQTKHSVKLNIIIGNHLHWTIPSDSEGDKIKFQLDVVAAGKNEAYAIPAGSPFTGEHTLIAAESGFHRKLNISEIPAVNTTISTIYQCRLTRVAASSDDYANEVYVDFDDSHVKIDTMGSRQELVK